MIACSHFTQIQSTNMYPIKFHVLIIWVKRLIICYYYFYWYFCCYSYCYWYYLALQWLLALNFHYFFRSKEESKAQKAKNRLFRRTQIPWISTGTWSLGLLVSTLALECCSSLSSQPSTWWGLDYLDTFIFQTYIGWSLRATRHSYSLFL